GGAPRRPRTVPTGWRSATAHDGDDTPLRGAAEPCAESRGAGAHTLRFPAVPARSVAELRQNARGGVLFARHGTLHQRHAAPPAFVLPGREFGHARLYRARAASDCQSLPLSPEIDPPRGPLAISGSGYGGPAGRRALNAIVAPGRRARPQQRTANRID